MWGALIWWAWSSARAHPTKGFGGWLILVAIGVTLAPLCSLGSLAQTAEPFLDVVRRPDLEAQAAAHLALAGIIALGLTLVIVQSTTATFMFQKSRRFPQMFIWAIICTLLVPPLILFWVTGVYSSYSGQTFWNVLGQSLPGEIGQWIGGTIGVVPWMLYVIKSRRVANTFVK
jgi:hypothetical protein